MHAFAASGFRRAGDPTLSGGYPNNRRHSLVMNGLICLRVIMRCWQRGRKQPEEGIDRMRGEEKTHEKENAIERDASRR
jgi:hypothetical protein